MGMQNSTSDREKIRQNIEATIANQTVMAIVFKDFQLSNKYPELVAPESLQENQFSFTGLLPLPFFGTKHTVHLDDILGCGIYNVEAKKYEYEIAVHLKRSL